MIIAYVLTAGDDDSSMLGPETYRPPPSAGFHDWRFGKDCTPHPATCPNCGRKIDKAYINPAFRAKHRSWDISVTYDGYYLASTRFRSFCEELDATNVSFIPLPADEQFFVFRAHSTLHFDWERRQTRFEQPCPACRDYYSVIGATPAFLREVTQPIQDGFFRTDLEFGSGHEQSPLILVGVATAELFRRQKFRKCDLQAVRE